MPLVDDQDPHEDTKQEWVNDDASKARVAAALADVDAGQSAAATCALCGQRTYRLDRFGLCSKKSQPHEEWRAGVRADEKAGAKA